MIALKTAKSATPASQGDKAWTNAAITTASWDRARNAATLTTIAATTVKLRPQCDNASRAPIMSSVSKSEAFAMVWAKTALRLSLNLLIRHAIRLIRADVTQLDIV